MVASAGGLEAEDAVVVAVIVLASAVARAAASILAIRSSPAQMGHLVLRGRVACLILLHEEALGGTPEGVVSGRNLVRFRRRSSPGAHWRATLQANVFW